MYEASTPGSTSSGRSSSPSYGPIHVPSGMVCLAHTPYPAPGIPDIHRPTSFGNDSTAFGNLTALLLMLLLLFTVFVSFIVWWGPCNWHCSVRSWLHPLHPRGRGEREGGFLIDFGTSLTSCFQCPKNSPKTMWLTSVSVAALIIQLSLGWVQITWDVCVVSYV